MNGRQGGNPAKLAHALIGLATSEQPPVRWRPARTPSPASSQKAKDLLDQVDAHRSLSSGLALDGPEITERARIVEADTAAF